MSSENNLESNENGNSDNNNKSNKSNKSNESNESNESNPTIPSFSKFSLISSVLTSTCNLPIVTKSIDSFLGIVSAGELIFGVAAWFTVDKVTSIGYISGGVFSGLTLMYLRKNRLQASMQQSVNVLQEENEELKESNEELKENIDDLEIVSKKLNEDLQMLKESIGLFDVNSDEVLNKFREIYKGLKKENEIHKKLNKNMIFLNIVQIVKMFENSNNKSNIKNSYKLSIDELISAKKALLNVFPQLDFNNLLVKIKKYDQITPKNIYECIKKINN